MTQLLQRLLSLSPLPPDHALTVTILDRIDILMRQVAAAHVPHLFLLRFAFVPREFSAKRAQAAVPPLPLCKT